MNTAGLPSRTCLTLYPYLARYALPKNYYYNYLILYFLNFLWCEVRQPYLLIRDARTMTFSTTIRSCLGEESLPEIASIGLTFLQHQ